MPGQTGEMPGLSGNGPVNLGTAAMVMLDLDGLKSVNDTYGHESGDIYIRETAVCMKGIPEDHAIVGRRSGDEFFILLFGYEDRNCVRKQLRDFYDILDKHPAVLPDGIQLKIQISSGIAWYGGELCTFEELVRCADIALYEAKSTMKGQTVEYRKDEASAVFQGEHGRGLLKNMQGCHARNSPAATSSSNSRMNSFSMVFPFTPL